MRLMLNGKLPSKEELAQDELIAQMLQEAEAKGKGAAPDKGAIIQALTIEEIPDAIKQALTKDAPTKETILQGLAVEEIPETIKQKIVEDAKVVNPVMQKFVDGFVGTLKNSTGIIAGNDDGQKVASGSMKLYQKLGSR